MKLSKIRRKQKFAKSVAKRNKSSSLRRSRPGRGQPNRKSPQATNKNVTDPKPEEDPVFVEYGEPFITNDKGKVRLNERAVAVKCARLRVLSYDHVSGVYERFNQERGLWLPIHEIEVRRLLGDLLLTLGKEYGQEEFVRLNQISHLKSLCQMLQTYQEEIPKQTTIGLVHVANGILDLRGQAATLFPHDLKFHFRSSSSLHYDPKAKCPNFINQLLKPSLPAEDIAALQKYFGSLLLGPNASHIIVLIRGTAGGGKSTLVTVVEKTLGESAVAQLRTKHLHGRFEIAAFIGKRLLVGKDVPGDTLSERGAQFLKSLTGGDLLEAEIKYSPSKQNLRGDYHVIIVSNDRLRVALSGDADAWERRLLVVDFRNPRPTQPIPNFAEKLIADEGSGILNWFIAGAMDYRKDLEKNGRLLLTLAQKRRVADLLHDSDSVGSFVEHCVCAKPGDDVTSEELLFRYFDECKKQGWTPVTSHEFQTRVPDLIALKFRVARRNDIVREGRAVRGYKGVALI